MTLATTVTRTNPYMEYRREYAERDAAVLEQFSRTFDEFKEAFYQMRLRLEIDADGYADLDALLMDAWNDCIAPSVADCKERLGQ
jgi:hypothetical protein